MSDSRDEKLERMLRSRPVAPASSDLERRIILKAQVTPRKRVVPLWQWIRETCAELHFPNPAYVLVAALIVGTMIGFNLPGPPSPAADEATGIVAFLSTEEIPL